MEDIINNQDNPLVSICIPAYNAETTLRKTLDSVLSQDYPNFEVIIFDNHSTDDTAKIASEYADRGVRYVLSPVSVGKESFSPGESNWNYALSPGESNWNYALSLAPGTYIALYHADDLYSPTMVRRQVECLREHPEVSSAFTMTEMIDESDRPIRRGTTKLPGELRGTSIFSFSELFDAILKYNNFIVTSTLMTRKETLKAVGNFNYQKFYTAAELDLWFRMARWHSVVIIDEPLHKYRIFPKQGSAEINKLRTHPAHYFKVMDYYLSKSENQRLASKKALNIYRTYRSADQVFCAVNLIIRGQMKEAKALLDKAITWSIFPPGYRNLRPFIQIIFGLTLKTALKFGMGRIIGRFGDATYHSYRKLKNKPI